MIAASRSLVLGIALSLATASFAADCEPVLVDGIRLHLPEVNALIAPDVDHDGRPDLVATSESATELTVWMNRPGGFFRGAPIALGHSGVLRLYEADIDGDGDRDIVAAGITNISTLFANANGTYSVVTSTAHNLHFVSAIGDLTADGKPDLAAFGQDRRLRVYAGSTDGKFTLIGTAAEQLGTRPPFSMEVAQLTGDTFGDLVITGDFGLGIFPGNGNGTFAARRSLNTFPSQRVATGDFDGDGRTDLLVRATPVTGRFYSSKDDYTTPKSLSCIGARTADLDDDGKLDAVSDVLQICKGNGDGTFTEQWNGATFLLDQVSFSKTASVADFNGDGKLDLAGASDSGDIAIFLAKPDLQFAGSRDYATTNGLYIDTADLNGDGRHDIITSGISINVFLADANGAFTKSAAHVGTGPSAAADVNGDGKLDLFAPSRTLLGNGDGTFQDAGGTSSSQYVSITAADVNGDQKTDFIASAVDFSSADDMASVFVRNGAGTVTETKHATGHVQLRDVAVADVNGDSFPDLLAIGTKVNDDDDGTLRMLPGRGDGTFGASVLIAERVSSNDVIAARIDGDAHVDLAISIYTADAGDAIFIFRGIGNGSFIERQRIPLPHAHALVRLTIGDFNGDGRRDLVAGIGAGERPVIWVLHQTEHGLFVPVSSFPWTLSDPAAAAGDFNGDSIDDLAVLGPPTIMDVHLSTCTDTLLASPARIHLFSPARSAKDQPVTFTAVIDAPNPGGTVAFYVDDRFVGNASVIGGNASFTTTFGSLTQRRIYAIYSGDGALSRAMSEVIVFDSIQLTGLPRRRASRR
jgi:hypothetical protein